jgi:hypothetical protein
MEASVAISRGRGTGAVGLEYGSAMTCACSHWASGDAMTSDLNRSRIIALHRRNWIREVRSSNERYITHLQITRHVAIQKERDTRKTTTRAAIPPQL